MNIPVMPEMYSMLITSCAFFMLKSLYMDIKNTK